LPLDAPDRTPEGQAMAQALTEELTTAAAAVPGLRVAARTMLAALQQPGVEVGEARARMGLAAVLEGSVRVGRGRVRLTVRLVDLGDGCQRWTGRFERELTDGFEAQDALVADVLGGLRTHLERLAADLPMAP
jgi:TolB-like protein